MYFFIIGIMFQQLSVGQWIYQPANNNHQLSKIEGMVGCVPMAWDVKYRCTLHRIGWARVQLQCKYQNHNDPWQCFTTKASELSCFEAAPAPALALGPEKLEHNLFCFLM